MVENLTGFSWKCAKSESILTAVFSEPGEGKKTKPKSAKPVSCHKMFLIQVNDLSEGTEFVRGCSALLHLWCDQNSSFFENEISGYY